MRTHTKTDTRRNFNQAAKYFIRRNFMLCKKEEWQKKKKGQNTGDTEVSYRC
jgi:hypothetical protein